MPKSCGYLLGYNWVCGAERPLVHCTVISPYFTAPPAGWQWNELNFVFSDTKKEMSYYFNCTQNTEKQCSPYGKFTNKETVLLISAAFLSARSSVMSVAFENGGGTTEVQSSCILCDWSPRSIHPGDSVTDNLISVQACSFVYTAHLSRKSVWHTHFQMCL